MDNSIDKKINNASKWSIITEIIAKLIAPVTNMILSRLLAPEVFGIIATVSMITSFADIFTDAGFQKYLIQHTFKNDKDLSKYANVAFFTNLTISIVLWILFYVFRFKIAIALGCEGLENVLVIAMFQLPITSFSSIQTALYRRKFDFRTLFYNRMIYALLPFFVTVPLALLGFNYWAVIIGTLSGRIVSSFLLTIKSNWKPKLFFSFSVLKKMLSFSMIVLGETIVKWLVDYFDTFMIGTLLSQYYLGIYKNSFNMANSIMTMLTTSLLPVLLSGLSRLKENKKEFKILLLETQKTLAYLLFPLGNGLFVYRKLATYILFGSQWSDAADVVGILALGMAIKLIFVDILSTAYVSEGKPQFSIISNSVYILLLIPITLLSIQNGFMNYVLVKNLSAFVFIALYLVWSKMILNIKFMVFLKNIIMPLINTLVMIVTVIILKQFSINIFTDFLIIFMAILIYFGFMYIFDKNSLMKIINIFFKKR